MLFVSIAVVAVTVIFLLLDTKKPNRFPPGPKWLPIVGNFLTFRRMLRKLGFHHSVWTKLSKKYGNIVGLRLGRSLVVTVSGSDAVKEVLMREEFDGRPDGFFFRLRTFGKRLGIIFSDGQLWQNQRKFSLQHLRKFGFGSRDMELKVCDETRELVKVLKSKCSKPLFMHDVFNISVLNVLWAMMAGERFSLDNPRLTELLQIIHDAFRIIDMSGGLINQMPFLRFIAPNACGYTQTVNLVKRMCEFFEETISEHRKTLCNSHPRDLIDAFLQKMDVNKDPTYSFTDEQLLSLCLDLFMAGSETTSNTLSFAILYMVRYPSVQQRVQDEMDEVVGRNRWPTVQDRIRMPYTEAVIMEIQRRTNVPPLGVAHRAVKDSELFGYIVPKGSIVLTNLYSVHMDSNFWKDPLEFKPERFLSDKGSVTFPEWHFIPFGHGKRRCLGEALARTSLFLFFTAILHNFRLESDPSSPSINLEMYDGATLSPKPFKALLIPRE